MAHLLAPVVELDQDPACPNKTLCVDDYDLMKQLYRGKASLLYRATCRFSRQPVALKLYRKHKLSTLNWYQVAREIQIHSGLDHDHIIALYGAFEDGKHVYLVQEFAPGGDLYEELKRVGGRFRERDTAMRVLAPCLQALAHCHTFGVIHRDIKPENILLGRNRDVKLADFGLSINHTQERPVTRAGTLDYMAPEVLVCPEKCRPEDNKTRSSLAYGRTIDVWAMGVLAYELIVGRPPFEKETRAATYESIMYRQPPYPSWLSESARSFINTALHKESKQRPDVLDLLQHPFIAAALPAARVPVTDIQPYPPAAAKMPFKGHVPRPAPGPGIIVSSFAVEAAKRQEESQSSFHGAAVSPNTGINNLSKRSLPALQRTESLPDVVIAPSQASGNPSASAPSVIGQLTISESLPVTAKNAAEGDALQAAAGHQQQQQSEWGPQLTAQQRNGSGASSGFVPSLLSHQSSSNSMAPEALQPQMVPAGGKGEYAEVLSLHADATTAGTLAYADYSHGGYQPYSLTPEDHEPGDADNPSPMSAMLTWAGASVKQLATKLLGSGSPSSPRQEDGISEDNNIGYHASDTAASLTISGSDHSATLQALFAVSSHSNSLDQLASGSRQGSLPADADGGARAPQGQKSAGDADMQDHSQPAAGADTAASSVAKRKRFGGFRRAMRAARPATALVPPAQRVSASTGSGIARASAELTRPASSGGPGSRGAQDMATHLGTWQVSNTDSGSSVRPTPAAATFPGLSSASATRSRLAATAARPTKTQPGTAHMNAKPAAVKGASFQRMASRSLGPADPRAAPAAAKKTVRNQGSTDVLDAGVERSASSLPSGKLDWAAAAMVSPFSAMSFLDAADSADAANNALGGGDMCKAAAKPPKSPGGSGSLKTRSALIVPALYGALAKDGGDEQLTSLRTRSVKDAAAAVAAAALGGDTALTLLDSTQEEASAADVLELLHHADSCDMDALPDGPTFTGEGSPLLSPLRSPKHFALALSASPLSGGSKVARTAQRGAGGTPADAVALLHQRSSMGAATAEDAWTIHTLEEAELEARNNLAV